MANISNFVAAHLINQLKAGENDMLIGIPAAVIDVLTAEVLQSLEEVAPQVKNIDDLVNGDFSLCESCTKAFLDEELNHGDEVALCDDCVADLSPEGVQKRTEGGKS